MIADAPVPGTLVSDQETVSPPIQTDLVAWYAEGFRDRLGDRLLLFDSTGPALELLRLNPQLAAVPGFEAALRARVENLKTFSHPVFARVRCVTTLDDPRPHLALVSELVPGERLSQVLRTVERHEVRPDPGAAVWLIRQLLPAVAALHERGDGIAHGLLGSERIVVTPEGGLAITEYVLAEGVQRLGLSVAELWRHFGIAARDTGDGPRLDTGSDLVQIGLLAVSVLLGRPLRDDEYPTGLGALLDEACSSQHWTLSPMLRPWLARALGVEGTPFASMDEARAQLDVLLPGVAGGWSPRLLPRADEPSLAAPGLRSAGASTLRERRTSPDAGRSTRHGATPAPAPRSGGAWPQPAATRAAGTWSNAGVLQAEAPRATRRDSASPDAVTISRLRRRLAVVGLLAAAEAAALVGMLATSGWPPSSKPVGAAFADIVSSLPALGSAPGQTGTSGVGQADVDSAHARALSSAAGWLAVSADVPVSVYANGELLGSTLAGRFQLKAGDHDLVLRNDAIGYRLTQRVRIRPGRLMHLTATLAREPTPGAAQR